ncbi:MAG: hypothetical protein KBS97_01205 [Firmicutes bacterium]|nr:hypothetical protein [Candidatus Fiminaster equi]
MISLIKLTENDKRLIIALLLVFILLFVIVGYVSLLVKKIMNRQASKADAMLKDVVEAKLFDKEKPFVKFGIRKNIRVFYREARIPFCIIAGGCLFLLLYCLFSGNWKPGVFSSETGFGSLFPELKWPTTSFFGMTIVNGWPDIVRHAAFKGAAWYSYIFVPVEAVGIVWFLICTQAYIARSLRIYKIARGIYRKKLDEEQPANPTPSNPIK